MHELSNEFERDQEYLTLEDAGQAGYGHADAVTAEDPTDGVEPISEDLPDAVTPPLQVFDRPARPEPLDSATAAVYADRPALWHESLPDNQGWRLLDPATQMPLSSSEPHAWIQADPELQAGMIHLGRHGSNIKVNVVTGRHMTAADLGDGFEDMAAASDALCFELFGWNRQWHAERLAEVASGERVLDDASYKDRILRAAGQLGADRSFSDEPEVNRSDLDDFLISLRKWTPVRGQTLDEDSALRWLSMRTLRERYKVAKFGAECMRLGLGVDDPAEVTMAVGSNHGGVLPRLGSLGVNLNVRYADGSGAPTAKGRVLTRASASGRISRNDLAVLL